MARQVATGIHVTAATIVLICYTLYRRSYNTLQQHNNIVFVSSC